MPAVDDLHSCHLHGLGTGQGSGLGGTPRPEEKGRICQIIHSSSCLPPPKPLQDIVGIFAGVGCL